MGQSTIMHSELNMVTNSQEQKIEKRKIYTSSKSKPICEELPSPNLSAHLILYIIKML